MPEISRFHGIRITMYFADHALPHFHAEDQHGEALERFRFDWSRLAGGGWRKLSDVLERGDPSPLSEARARLQGQGGGRSPPSKACGQPLASDFERMRPPESKTL